MYAYTKHSEGTARENLSGYDWLDFKRRPPLKRRRPLLSVYLTTKLLVRSYLRRRPAALNTNLCKDPNLQCCIFMF